MACGNNQNRDATPQRVKRAGWAALYGLLVVGLSVWLSGSAHALIVGTKRLNPITQAELPPPDTSAAPTTSTPGWTHGNGLPWLNEVKTQNFLNGVYIGDGWVLTARHVGANPVQFSHLASQIDPIPSQSFDIKMPGQGTVADLQLFRIKSDPGLPKLTIASQPPSPNGTSSGALGQEVVVVANGVTRGTPENHYWANTSVNPPAWTEVANTSTYNGYRAVSSGRRWGTNQVSTVDDSDSNVTADVINPNSGVHTLSYFTRYDENSSNLYEAQVVGGDSGSPVFYERDGQWELTGIVVANLISPGQSTTSFNSSNTIAIYGNRSAFADLSSYSSEIQSLMYPYANDPTHGNDASLSRDYSIMGDVNLDGVVSGNGTGPVATDDISAFVAGWRNDSHKTVGDLTSWSKGDLNRDGKTNAADFFKLRQAFGATGSWTSEVSAFTSAVLGVAVPEPSTAMLLVLAAGSFLATARRRRSRPTA